MKIIPEFIHALESAKSGIYNDNLGLRECRGMNYCDLLLKSGIIIKQLSDVHNLTQKIIFAIDKNCPVIIYIDCFYEPIRVDTYNKIHIPHSITIFGYDIEKEVFNIIEHDYVNGFTYQKQTLSFSDIENSYRGVVEAGNKDISTYYEIKHDLVVDANWNYNTTFMYNYLNNADRIAQGINDLESFLTNYYLNKKDEMHEESQSFNFVDLSSRKILRNHKMRNFAVSSVFKENTAIVDFITQITNDWFQVMALFTKYKVSTAPNKKLSFDKCAENLCRILENEKVIHQKIIEYCKLKLVQE